jgi:thiol-disulfide isomerase/thioredoxin
VNGRITAAIVLLAALAGIAGYYAYSRRVQADATAAIAAAAANAEAATPPQHHLVDTVPDLQLVDRAGLPRSLKDWPGKSLIVNFWATWCAPCRREIPLLQRIDKDRAGDGFQVIGIAVDFRDKVLQYANEMKIGYPLLIGEQDGLDAAAAFGVDAIGFPFTIFTDARGRVIVAHMGELTQPEADLILGAIARVNDGRSNPAAARAEIAARLPALKPETDENGAG